MWTLSWCGPRPAQREHASALGGRGDRPRPVPKEPPHPLGELHKHTTTQLMLQTPSAAERSPSWGNGEGGAAGDVARPCQQLPTCNAEVRLEAEPSQARARPRRRHSEGQRRGTRGRAPCPRGDELVRAASLPPPLP